MPIQARKKIVHCWEDGPRDEDDRGSTCMLADGHDGDHEWTRDDQITVRFAPSSEQKEETT